MEKNPVEGYIDNTLAAIFTMMLPGLGQMLKGQTIPGLIWAPLVGGSYLINGWLGMGFHVACILDAAFGGGVAGMMEKASWVKKGSLFVGLAILLFYTCIRTALF